MKLCLTQRDRPAFASNFLNFLRLRNGRNKNERYGGVGGGVREPQRPSQRRKQYVSRASERKNEGRNTRGEFQGPLIKERTKKRSR